MMKIIGPSVTFGTRQSELKTRRNFLKTGLGAAASAAFLPLDTIAFSTTPKTAPKQDIQAAREKAAKAFDNLVEDYTSQIGKTMHTYTTTRDKLREIQPAYLTPKYQALHRIFDNQVRRDIFFMQHGSSLNEYYKDCDLDDFLEMEGIGQPLYDELLQINTMTGLSSQKLLQIAEKEYKRFEAALVETALELETKYGNAKSWKARFFDLSTEYPPYNKILDAYKQDVERSLAFLEKKDLITVPKSTVQVVETTGDAKKRFPFASYFMDKVYVTLSTDDDPTKRDEQLRIHSDYERQSTVVHEAYPGHHLQNTYYRQLYRDKSKTEGKVIWLVPSSSEFEEGWAHYAEELMLEEGYYKSPEEKLFAYRDLLWRAARAILEVKIHTGTISYNEAREFLLNNILLPPDRVDAELKRYYKEPAGVSSYMTGRLMIRQLREKLKEAQGDSFDLKTFHDTFINNPELPIAAIAALRFNQQISL